MDHPLLDEANLDLRKRVVHLLTDGYNIKRSGDFIFVCGGNDAVHMRMRFREYCSMNTPEFEIFFPEYAMKDYFSGDVPEPFDIADFEELIGELSRAIVLFPEAAGSFAEVGYFSALPNIIKKTILALDLEHQGSDSFISMGPAKKIGAKSLYHPAIQISYKDPKFDTIVKRINRIPSAITKKNLEIGKFREASSYELMCLISRFISILSIARMDDIIYMMRSLYRNHIGLPRIRKILSILVGSGYVAPVGDYGHYHVSSGRSALSHIRDGKIEEENRLLLDLAEMYQGSDPEFLSLVEESRGAH